MTIKNTLQADLDNASQYLEALCEILGAANDSKLTASALHTVLRPISRQLNMAAGQLSDSLQAPQQ